MCDRPLTFEEEKLRSVELFWLGIFVLILWAMATTGICFCNYINRPTQVQTQVSR